MIAAILRLPKSLPTGTFTTVVPEPPVTLFEVTNPWFSPQIYLADTLRKVRDEKRNRR